MANSMMLRFARWLNVSGAIKAFPGQLREYSRNVLPALFLSLYLACGAANAFDTTPYSPLPTDGQWSYLRNNSEPVVVTVEGTRNIGGVPVTVLRSSDGVESYSIVNSSGTYSYGGAVRGGALEAAFAPGAPMKVIDANATLGVPVSSSGTITLTIPDIGSFPFQYTMNSTPEAFEAVTVPAGTFDTLRLSSVMHFSGVISGPEGSVALNIGVTTTSWLASGVGSVKTVTQTSEGSGESVTDIEELESLNFLPVLTFSSTSADWGSQAANGSPGSVLRGPMVANNSLSTITLESAVSGEFSLASGGDCTVLDPGQYCFIGVDFRPVSVGEKSGALTITSNAIGSPFVHPLRGIGAGVGIATLTPNALDFGNQDRGVASPAQTVTLNNAGSAALTISYIDTTGQYAQTNNCGTSLAIGATCKINVSFTPFGTGMVDGSLIIDTLSERLFVSLLGNGIGTAPPVSVSAPRLSFGAQQIGTTSAVQSFTLKNEGNSHLNIYSMGPDMATPLNAFTFASSCPAVLPAGESCVGNVRFAPTSEGEQYGYLSIHTDGVPSGDFLLVFSGIGATGPVDTTPAPFSFTEIAAAPLHTRVASDTVVITGIDAAAPIAVSGGSYRIDNGLYSEQPGIILAGQSVTVYIGTGTIPGKRQEATLTIGGVSAIFSVTTALGSVPTAPANVAAVAGNGWAWISFSPPASNGGFPVTNYEANCTAPDSGQVVGVIRSVTDAAPLLIGPLINDLNYTCVVRAINGAGPGPYSSASNGLIPTADAGPTPIYLWISGPATLSAGTGANYTATVTFNDTTTQAVSVDWSAIGLGASMGASGALSTDVASGDQRVAVRASYTSGITLAAETIVTITDSTSGGSFYTATLGPGWNLIGYGASGKLDVPTLFGDENKVTTVWKWLMPTANWAFYAPSESDGGASYAAAKGYDFLTSVDGGEGFWVNAKTAFDVQLPVGTAVSSASFMQMDPGWHLIAVGDGATPSEFNLALSPTQPAAGEIPLNLTTLWTWSNAQGNWYFYAPSLEKTAGLTNYLATKGYLDFGPSALGSTKGFWVNKP